jgi:4-oxalocrotonate tautomerase
MPLIQVSMAEGRSTAQKKALLEAITAAVHDSIGAPVESIRVWVHEFPPTDYIAGGEVLADRRAREDRERLAAQQQQAQQQQQQQ